MLAESPYLVFAGLAGLLYFGSLAVNAPVLAWLVIALQPAALIVPFFPGRPFWWELCALLAWPSLLAHFLVNRKKLEVLQFDRLERRALLALVGYVGVLVVLMLYRGVGFRAFGGEQMGGRFYVQQVVLSILPVLMASTMVSRRQLVTAVCAGWILSATYMVSDFSFIYGGATQKILYFFEVPTDAINFQIGFEATGVRRFQSLWCVGVALLSALLAWMPLRDIFGRRIWIGLPIGLGAVALALVSGHRTAFIQAVITVGLLSLFQKFWTPLRVLSVMFLIAIGGVTLYVYADHFPLPIQRSISFLPGIKIDPLARDNAVDTLNDRVEVLKLAINDIPKYWLIGRGFGMDRFDVLPSDSYVSGVWQMYVNGYFYNGLIGSLLKLGVVGFVCTGFFIICISRMAFLIVGRIREISQWSVFERIGLLLCAQWFSLVIWFYGLTGDVNTWTQYFILHASLITVFYRSLVTDSPKPSTEDVSINSLS